MVSGIAAVMLLYMAAMRLQGKRLDMLCLDTIAKYLFYVFLIDFSLEMLDLLHRIYEADESFRSLDFMVHTRLWTSQVLVQILLGTCVPLALLAAVQVSKFGEAARKRIYVGAGLLTLVGIFAMRWNVVIGGQLFSKSYLGYTSYKLDFATREGLLPAIVLMLLPFGILWVLAKMLPPWQAEEGGRDDVHPAVS
jgi:Ni/Fe-hydrogenase subunit HybB-like protein